MTSKITIVDNGEAIVGNTLSDDLEYRDSIVQSYGNYPNPVVIHGLDVTAVDQGGGSFEITVNPGEAFLQGKLFKIEEADTFTINPSEDTIIAIYYNATNDVSPNYDCFTIETIVISSWEFPSHSPSGNAYCPLAIFDYSASNIVNEVKPRVPLYYLKQDAGFIGYDLTSDKNGVLDVINTSPTTSGLENYSIRARMDNDNGYAIVSDGKTRLKDDVVINDNTTIYDSSSNDLFNFVGGKIGIGKSPVVELDINGDLDCDNLTADTMNISGNTSIGGMLTIADLTVSSTLTMSGYVNSNFSVVGTISASNGISSPSATSYFNDSIMHMEDVTVYYDDATINLGDSTGATIIGDADITLNGAGNAINLTGSASHLDLEGGGSFISLIDDNAKIIGSGTSNYIDFSGNNCYINLDGNSTYINVGEYRFSNTVTRRLYLDQLYWHVIGDTKANSTPTEGCPSGDTGLDGYLTCYGQDDYIRFPAYSIPQCYEGWTIKKVYLAIESYSVSTNVSVNMYINIEDGDGQQYDGSGSVMTITDTSGSDSNSWDGINHEIDDSVTVGSTRVRLVTTTDTDITNGDEVILKTGNSYIEIETTKPFGATI